MLVPNKVSRRVGNWCEESVLREEKLREFLSKIESGEVGFKRRARRLELALQPTPLSKVLAFDENIMIQSTFTKGFLVADIPEHYPDLRQDDVLTVSASTSFDVTQSKARGCFRLVRKTDLGPGFDKRPTWSEKFYIAIHLPEVSQPLFLGSEMRTLSCYKTTEQQRVYLTFKPDYNCIWQFDWLDKSFRMEMEGKAIQAGEVGLITHSHTGRFLASDFSSIVRNADFGTDWAVDCHSHRDNCTRVAKPPNYWVFRTASSSH